MRAAVNIKPRDLFFFAGEVNSSRVLYFSCIHTCSIFILFYFNFSDISRNIFFFFFFSFFFFLFFYCWPGVGLTPGQRSRGRSGPCWPGPGAKPAPGSFSSRVGRYAQLVAGGVQPPAPPCVTVSGEFNLVNLILCTRGFLDLVSESREASRGERKPRLKVRRFTV